MNLHINYETVKPYTLQQLTTTYEARNEAVWESFKKAKLKANKDIGEIIIDEIQLQNKKHTVSDICCPLPNYYFPAVLI